jgi:hypothetical protein
MHKMPLRKVLMFLLSLTLFTTVSANAQKKDELKNQYKDVEVVKFEVQDGVKFPPEHMEGMMVEIAKELENLHKFRQVFSEGQTQTATGDPTIRLVGTVTKYEPGSQAKRYLIGFGAGKTKVVAHVKFIDKASGNVLFEKDVDGKVVMGIFGGQSKTSLKDVGKEIAEVAKKQFF